MTTIRFDLKTPCNLCPFRNDSGNLLVHPDRLDAFHAGGELGPGGQFQCHKTTHLTVKQPRDKAGRFSRRTSQACAGSMIFAANIGEVTSAMQIAERLGWCGFRVSSLDMDAPVFKSREEVKTSYSGG